MFGIKTRLMWSYFDRIQIPLNIFCVRRKDRIRVLFVLTDIALWKTESLYQKMLEHPRFAPILGIVPTYIDKESARERIREYCKKKGYPYEEISTERTLVGQTKADIILYSEPYQSNYHPKHRIFKNRAALFVYVYYAFHSILEKWTTNEQLLVHAWQNYFENDTVAREFACQMSNQGRNILVTGLPIMDQLLDMGSTGEDPWKNISGKKRIIYAPHHTIGSESLPNMPGIDYSTFLEYADFMLEMARKYKDSIHMAFKPHPYLRLKLLTVWGEKKTDEYYKQWEEMENTQLEMGDYISLFYYSDAMIHDCSSFRVEYLYTHKPVMYLVKGENHGYNCTQFVRDAFGVHEHGRSKEQIEAFIVNVINGIDIKKEEREAFYQKNLLPPGGQSASDNIIDAILGKKIG